MGPATPQLPLLPSLWLCGIHLFNFAKVVCPMKLQAGYIPSATTWQNQPQTRWDDGIMGQESGFISSLE